MLTKEPFREILRSIVAASKRLEVDSKWLVAFAYLESGFDQYAINGVSRGLFQMQEGAWSDAKKLVVLPDYNRYWADSGWNALAAAAYMRLNLMALAEHALNAEEEPRWLYLAHQQGVSGLVYLIDKSKGKHVNKQVVTDQAMRRNPTPGYAVTVDPAEFYSNWMTYLQRYFR
jgi:hypothetical protein